MGIVCYQSGQAIDFEAALELLRHHSFITDAWPGLSADQAAQYALEDCRMADQAWALVQNGRWQWLAALGPLRFDSELTGLKMSKISLLAHRQAWPEPKAFTQGREFMGGILIDQRERNLDFLLARVPSRDILSAQIMEDMGFRLADASVEWMLDLDNLPEYRGIPQGFAIRPWQEADAPLLGDLAGSTMCDLDSWADRFAMDPNLRPTCPELYRLWLKNSLSGDQADQVLVLEAGGEAAGFITIKLPRSAHGPEKDCGWVVLNAITPDLRGQGLYNGLLLRALDWLHENGARLARVRTKISQQAVIRAWSRLGARQVHSDFTFHLWLD